MDCKELLSAVEATQLLKITKNTVYKLVKRGEILFLLNLIRFKIKMQFFK